jgi:hypothetical protein
MLHVFHFMALMTLIPSFSRAHQTAGKFIVVPFAAGTASA